AGRPVAVQSPARNRLPQPVFAIGRSAFCSGVAANVARRSRTICQGGNVCGRPDTFATSLQIAHARSARGAVKSSPPSLMVTEIRLGSAKIHSQVPLITPSIGGK